MAGVVWPSKRYTTGIDAELMQADRVAAGTLAADGNGQGPIDLTNEELAAALNDAVDGFDFDGAVATSLAEYRARPNQATAQALILAVSAQCSFDTADIELARVGSDLKTPQDDMGDTLAKFAVPPRIKPTAEAAQTLGLMETVRGLFTGPR